MWSRASSLTASPQTTRSRRVEGYRDEIWALGLRNPWGFAFDKKTGALYIPDAGHSSYEEVNYQPASSAGGQQLRMVH